MKKTKPKPKWVLNPEWVAVGEKEKKQGWGLRLASDDPAFQKAYKAFKRGK